MAGRVVNVHGIVVAGLRRWFALLLAWAGRRRALYWPVDMAQGQCRQNGAKSALVDGLLLEMERGHVQQSLRGRLAVVVEENVVGGNGLQYIVGRVQGRSLPLRRKHVGGRLVRRRAGNVRFLIVPKQVVQRGEKLAAAQVVLAVVGL